MNSLFSLPEDRVSEKEVQHFGKEKVESLDHLKLRNFIVNLFAKSVQTELTLEETTKQLSESFDPKSIQEVYDFLVSNSYVNFGLIDAQMEDVEDVSDGIIVLGAGVAGMACARQLGNLGHKVTLIDLKDSKEHCAWTNDDPETLAILCKQAGAEIAELTFDLDHVQLYQGLKEILAKDSSTEAILEFLNEVVHVFLDQSDGTKVEELRTELGYDEPKEPILPLPEEERSALTLGELFQRALIVFNIQLDEETTNELLWRFALLEFREGAALSQISGTSSPKSLNSFHFVRGGFAQVFTKLMETLPKTVDQVSAKIEDMTIEWSEKSGEASKVQIKVGENAYKGTALVFAHPISVLKETLDRFEPPLPEWKRNAVEALGVGCTGHTVLQFPTQFWSSTPAFGLVGSRIVAPDEIAKLATSEDKERGASFLFLNLTSAYDKPTLLCLHSGDAAQTLPDTLKALKSVYGDEIPEPDETHVEKIIFPFVTAKSSASDIQSLSKPIDDTLFFARGGERGPGERFFNGVRAAREVHQNRAPARKRKAPETFAEPPAKKQALEDLTAPVDVENPKAPTPTTKAKKMQINAKDMNIFTDVDFEKIRDANTPKVVQMTKGEMDDQKSRLMNGMFTFGNKAPEKWKARGPQKRQTITSQNPGASPPKRDLPSPALPTIDAVKFSDDEDQTSDLPKAPTPKKSKSSAKASSKSSKKEKYKEGQKKIQKYVKKVMGQIKNASKLKTDQRKEIVKKATKKVFEDYREKLKKGKSVKWEDFMQRKRKDAVKSLVKRYVKNFQ